MAVKTVFSENELKEMLAPFELGKYAGTFALNGGTVQTNIGLLTTTGRFVLRYYENRSLESVRFETDLLVYLKHRGYPCASPYLSKEGAYAGMYRMKPYAIFEFMEGEHASNPTPEQKEKLIAIVAELHQLTENFVPIHHESRWNYDPALCLKLAGQAAERLHSSVAYRKLAWMENEVLGLRLPSSLPKGICHADLHFTNVLFQRDEISAVLDFDDANFAYPIFDLVGLMEAWAWRHDADDTLRFEVASKIVRAYNDHRPLTYEEKEHLFDVYKLSILFDSVWFFDRGDAEDFYEKRKIDYLNGLGREDFKRKLFG